MRAKELVPILAEIWGVPFETAFMIDRSLFEAGLREKAVGRRLPEISREEALRFMLACLVTKNPTKAAVEVAPWLSASGIAPVPMPDRHDDKDDDFLDEDFDEHRAARDELVCLLDPHISRFKSQHPLNPKIGIVDFLLVLCHLFQTSKLEPGSVKLELILSHPVAEVSFSTFSGNANFLTMHFFPEMGQTFADYDTSNIRRSTSVYGEAMTAIIARTVDPLEVAD